MRVVLRRLRPGETDWELIWSAVLAATALMGGTWIALGLPTPKCVIYHSIGWPCLSCGGTRTARALLHGDLAGAWSWNPLVAVVLVAAGVFLVYSGVVCGLRLPRLRLEGVSRNTGLLIRMALVVVLACNWIYLVFRFSGDH
jgi:hypothetical protein